MGSLKDDIRVPSEDHQQCERTEDEEHPGSSDSSPTTDNLPINTSQPSTSQDNQPNVHTAASCDTQEDNSGAPEVKSISGGACGEDSDFNHVKDCTQTGCVTPTQHPAATPLEPSANEYEDTPTSATNDARRGNDNDGGRPTDRDVGGDQRVPAQHPLLPSSPAPSGQHHMHTQVSLEVVTCHSAATSPMTPPEGDQAFFFPLCYGRPGAAEAQTKDAELQVGRQVEFRSVATAPMTPRTPVATTFPEIGDGAERRRGGEGQPGGVAGRGGEETRFPSDVFPENPSDSRPAESADRRVVTEDSHPEGRQHVQKMVSRDQDITILVTHHGSTEDEDEEGATEVESTHYPIGPETGVANADNTEEASQSKEATEKQIGDDGTGCVQRGPAAHVPQTKIATKEAAVLSGEDSETDKQHSGLKGTKEEAGVSKEPRVEPREEPQAAQPDSSLTKPPMPGSPAPSGSSHHIHTQVSLEVVQCHSVATSPMTPPNGGHAFFFPNACDRSEMKDAEMQVGQQVEFRSIATAPMTPRTPTTPMGFPEIRREESKEEKISEEKILQELIIEEKMSEKIIEEKNIEEKISEEKISEKIIEEKILENISEKILEEKISEEKISEDKIIEEKNIEEKISEDKILEEKNIEEKISEEKISEEKISEEKISEDKILEEEEVSEKTIERSTVDAEAASTEDTGADTAAEETTSGTADEEPQDGCEEKCEEPVQEVSWDEKGMTWEVYGAVVEVAVLGSAIQKHLEKQVKKQRKQPSLPPPPPLNPAALPLPSASPAEKQAGRKRERDAKAGRRRRNPFRLLLQNIQQPHCCSRAHASD